MAIKLYCCLQTHTVYHIELKQKICVDISIEINQCLILVIIQIIHGSMMTL